MKDLRAGCPASARRRILAGFTGLATAMVLLAAPAARANAADAAGASAPTAQDAPAAVPPGGQPATAISSRTDVDAAGGVGVRVGGTTYVGHPTAGCAIALWILGLDRVTLQPLHGQGEMVPLCTPAERATLTAKLADATRGDGHAIVVLNTLDRSGPAPTVPADLFRVDALRRLGFTDDQLTTSASFGRPLDLASDALSAIGVVGAAPGEGWWSVGSRTGTDPARTARAGLTGQMVIDTHSRYRFVSLAAQQLDVSADGSITIDGVRTRPPGAGTGVHLAIYIRNSLARPWVNFFYRLDGGAEQAARNMTLLTAAVNTWRTRPDALIVLTTNGGLSAAPADHAIRVRLAAAVQTIGGTPDAIFNLTGAENYSVVTVGAPDAARPAPIEASPELQPGYYDPATPIRALLTPSTTNQWVTPKVGGSGANPYAFELTLATSARPWPVPAPGSAGQALAFSWWGNQLCSCGAQLRTKYVDGATSGWQHVLTSASYPSDASPGFTKADFTAVKDELQAELNAAGDVRALEQRLTQLLNALSTADSGLVAAWDNVKIELKKAQINLDAPDATPIPVQITSLLFGVLSNAPTIGVPIQIISGLLDYLQSLTARPERPADYELDTTIGGMVDALAHAQHDRLTNFGNVFEIIYTNYGLLTSVGHAVKVATPGTPWYFTPNQAGVFAGGAYRSAQANFYRAILPKFFSGMQMLDAPSANIRAWGSECGRARQSCPPDQQAFANYTDARQSLATGSTTEPDPRRYLLSVLGYGKRFLTLAGALLPQRPATPMSTELLTRLTNPTTDRGLGIPLAEIYRHWGFPILTVTYATRFERIIGIPGRGGRSVSIPCWEDARYCYVKLAKH